MLHTGFILEGLFTHSLSLCPARVWKKLSLPLATMRNTFVRETPVSLKSSMVALYSLYTRNDKGAAIIKIFSLNSDGMMRFQDGKNLAATLNCQKNEHGYHKEHQN